MHKRGHKILRETIDMGIAYKDLTTNLRLFCYTQL